MKNKSSSIVSKLTPRAKRKFKAEAEENNFSYAFSRKGITILNFVVQHNFIDNPPDSGDFFSAILDPNDPPQIRVTVVAREDAPAGSGSLALKYLGKDVFSPPENIPINKGRGGFDKLVSLPQ